MNIEEAVTRAIAAVDAGKRLPIGVALSGGADSVALLIALRHIGHDVVGLHCDFSLRGSESDGDCEYCRQLCASRGIPLHVVKFDTIGEQRQGESVEMACRRLRYGWFEEMAHKLGLKYIALGHHREDSIETIMLNLTRGTGPRGLAGMAVLRGIYLRPMLDVGRGDIERYLAGMGAVFRVDSSNLANDYRRNALRNTVLPELYRYIPTAEAGIMHTARTMAHADAMLTTYIDWCADKYACGGMIDIDAMRADNVDLHGTLYLLIPKALGVNATSDVISQILDGSADRGSRLFPAAGGENMELYNGRLQRFVPLDDVEVEVRLDQSVAAPVAIEVTAASYRQFRDEAKSNLTMWLCADNLDASARFTLRHWRHGDAMHPFGAPGRRKISDIFTDMKMSRSQKNAAWLLTLDGRPIWIVGRRAANILPVDENSRKIIKLHVKTPC